MARKHELHVVIETPRIRKAAMSCKCTWVGAPYMENAS